MPVMGASVLLGGVALLGGCGEPPAPAVTAPPVVAGSAGAGPSSSALPSLGLPTMPTVPPAGGLPPGAGVPPAGLPTGGLPPGGPPTGLPPLPNTPPVPGTTTTPATPIASPAPRCTAGPSPAQIVAVVRGTAGIPDRPLTVTAGPFCSGTWQYSTIEIVPRTGEKKPEPLFVVTTGKPAALELVEAGTDVCTKRVRADAPPGIRVLACGV
ncbi:hypothetical protein GCM10010166_12210 [Couchioplanes caeruleus subsp. azureus]|nr:hypothetical protein GCM10010166_12210 [Couchioplanes caeruleus subsp. azureus]